MVQFVTQSPERKAADTCVILWALSPARRGREVGSGELPVILVIETSTHAGNRRSATNEAGFAPHSFSGEEALTLLRAVPNPITRPRNRLKLKQAERLDVARRIREIEPACPVVLKTGAGWR